MFSTWHGRNGAWPLKTLTGAEIVSRGGQLRQVEVPPRRLLWHREGPAVNPVLSAPVPLQLLLEALPRAAIVATQDRDGRELTGGLPPQRVDRAPPMQPLGLGSGLWLHGALCVCQFLVRARRAKAAAALVCVQAEGRNVKYSPR